MKPLIRITGPLRCCLSLLQSRRRRRRRLDDPSPFPIVMILPFSSSKNVVVGLVEIIIRERKRKRKGPLNMASTGSILGFVEKAITGRYREGGAAVAVADNTSLLHLQLVGIIFMCLYLTA
ncbi:uncharacterized protein LOC107625721 isoform X5 [Arachis ipaensis]|uniref:uncharacterized protein LOC107625721 isoform X5 n=1 Tax=Arachis ipaensis TaxID=130454 RepID=UPI0007AF93BA|nr:uncharacterized protein LOC107625721 isoform X5 [Arachis ipaensis]XP_025633700.1 uncharacterized protein LOC112727955 isoform X3 [Arachis hypogaea]